MKNFLIVSQIVLIIVIIFISRSCNEARLESQNNKMLADSYLSESQKFKAERDNLGRQIVEQEQVIIGKDREIEKKILENSRLTKLNSQIKIRFETEIKDLIAHYDSLSNEPIFIFDCDSLNVPIGVKFGTKVKTGDEWFSFSGTIKENGLRLDTVSFTNRFTITVGERRDGIFKPLKSYVEVASDNPYTSINSLNNITVNRNKSLWNKPWFNFLLGGLAGTAATTAILYGVK